MKSLSCVAWIAGQVLIFSVLFLLLFCPLIFFLLVFLLFIPTAGPFPELCEVLPDISKFFIILIGISFFILKLFALYNVE